MSHPSMLSDAELVNFVNANPDADVEIVGMALEAQDRLEAARIRQDNAARAEEEAAELRAAAEAEARQKADEAIKAVEAKMAERRQKEFEQRVGPKAIAALSRLKACLQSKNDGGTVAAYRDYKKFSRNAHLPSDLQEPVRAAFGRYDAKVANHRRKS